jgi:hypothetical protein
VRVDLLRVMYNPPRIALIEGTVVTFRKGYGATISHPDTMYTVVVTLDSYLVHNGETLGLYNAVITASDLPRETDVPLNDVFLDMLNASSLGSPAAQYIQSLAPSGELIHPLSGYVKPAAWQQESEPYYWEMVAEYGVPGLDVIEASEPEPAAEPPEPPAEPLTGVVVNRPKSLGKRAPRATP